MIAFGPDPRRWRRSDSNYPCDLWNLGMVRIRRHGLSLHRLIDRLTSPDIIALRVEAILSDRLHWCGLQGLG